MSKLVRFILLTTLSLCLYGCFDKVELENRGFVNTISVDKSDDTAKPFAVGTALADLSENINNSSNEEKSGKEIKTQSSETFISALKLASSHSSKSLYYGLAKVCLIGEEILKDEKLLSETIDGLERNSEISRKLIMLAVEGKASDILSAELKDEPLPGMFITKFYQNSGNFTASTLRLDLENFIKGFRFEETLIIPKIKYNDGDIEFSGAALIKDRNFRGYLQEDELKGLLWIKSKAKGAQIVGKYENTPVALSVHKIRSKIKFSEEENRLSCQPEIYVEGTIEEFAIDTSSPFDTTQIKALEELFQDVISKEISNTFTILQKTYNIDGFYLKDHLRKWYNNLYKAYNSDWENTFNNMLFSPKITVRITNTGSLGGNFSEEKFPPNPLQKTLSYAP